MQNGTFVRIFIASPGDVYQERDEACRMIHNWNAAHSMSRSVLIEPVRVETHTILAVATMSARSSVRLNSDLRIGQVVSAGGQCLNSPGDERSEAKWESGLEQLEIVPVDGGIGAARLNDLSRKTLREHSFLEFAEPEGDED